MSRDNFIRIRGAWNIRHWIRIPSLTDRLTADRIETMLGTTITGVRQILTYPKKRKIRVVYDQTKTNFQQILKRLDDAGLPAANDWWSSNKARWFQYLDRKACINAGVPAPPCLSNPTKILNQRDHD